LDPGKCVKCNAPSDGEVVVNTYPYHGRLFYFARGIFPIVRIYRTIAEYVQKDVIIGVFICERHRKRRSYAMLSVGSLGIGGMVLFVWNLLAHKLFEVGAIAAVMCLASVDAFPTARRVLRAEHVDKKHIWLAGVSPLYLSKIPKMPMVLRRFD